MPLELIDTHCHLDLEPLGQAVEAVLARAQAAGVRRCITIGTSVESSRANIELARRFPMLRAAVGVHPNDAGTVTDETFAQIDALAADPHVVAIGEVGLDDYRTPGAVEAQRPVLRGFMDIARRRRLPLLIHCRGTTAYDALLMLLREHASGSWRGIIHCASGSPAFIEAAIGLGLHVSFAGNVTFRNAHELRRLVPLVPDDRLLIETDAPFLAPQPVRGMPNEPAYVAHTAAHLAQLRGETVERVGELTSRNARELFGFSSMTP